MSAETPQPDPEILRYIVQTKMPFGKFKGTLIADLPDFYLEYLARTGFSAGRLGAALSTMHVIASNGLRQLLIPLRSRS